MVRPHFVPIPAERAIPAPPHTALQVQYSLSGLLLDSLRAGDVWQSANAADPDFLLLAGTSPGLKGVPEPQWVGGGAPGYSVRVGFLYGGEGSDQRPLRAEGPRSPWPRKVFFSPGKLIFDIFLTDFSRKCVKSRSLGFSLFPWGSRPLSLADCPGAPPPLLMGGLEGWGVRSHLFFRGDNLKVRFWGCQIMKMKMNK